MFPKKNINHQAQKRHTSLRTSLFFQTFFFLLLCTIGTALVAYMLARREFTIRTMSQLQSTVHTKGAFFEGRIAREKEQLSILGRHDDLLGLSSITKIVGFSAVGMLKEDGKQSFLDGNRTSFDSIPLATIADIQKSSTTLFVPIVSERGWTGYIIAAPRVIHGTKQGTLIALFDATPLLVELLENNDDRKTAEILLLRRSGNDTTLLHSDKETGIAVRIYERERARSTPLIEASLADEAGILQTKDYAGIPVLAAYRKLPSVGWSIIAKVDSFEVATPIIRIAINLLGVGLLLVSLLSLSMYFLARRIAEPLEELATKLQGLEAKRWNFTRSIFSGNEIEDVDTAAADLTHRVQTAYEHLEAIIAEKSSSLRKEFAENKTILESMDYGVLITNREGQVSYLNRSGEVLVGFEERAAIDVDATEVLRITDVQQNILKGAAHPVSAVLASHTKFVVPVETEYSLRRADGSITPIHIRVTPILAGLSCLGAVAIFRDMTEERHIDHLKTEFISLVSHQLRTPLSSMRWYLEMLLSLDAGPLNVDQKEYVEEVVTSNTRMVHLVNALLNVSRLELGKMKVETESVDPRKIVADVAVSLGLEIKRRKQTLQTLCEIQENFTVKSDRGVMQLIVENFLSNAIKYGDEGSTIDVVLSRSADKKKFAMSVRSTGIEISEEQKQNIGKKLFRSTSARLTNTDGNGLGLYISKVAAEAIGATIDFESVKSVTTVILSLPI